MTHREETWKKAYKRLLELYGKNPDGMDGYTVDVLKNLGFQDWFSDYLLRVAYMSTKALAVLELKYTILLTWYRVYFPAQYARVKGGEAAKEDADGE